jgi:outer membrane protein assembly factor BamB
MLQNFKNPFYYLILCLLVFNTYKTNAQNVLFNTQVNYSPSELSNFLSSITLDEDAIYFIANDYNLYSIENKTKKVLYTTEINSKSNDAVFILKDTLITSLYENNKHSAVFINKNSGQIIRKLNVSPLKTAPQFLNDSIFVATTINNEGGQLFAYDLHNNTILWEHFVGHGYNFKPYIKNETILANFDYDEWKTVTLNGEIEEEIVEEYETNNKMKLLHVFYTLSHDEIEIKQEFLSEYFSNIENIKVKTNSKNTVILSQNKIVVLADNAEIISNKEFSKIIQLPNEGENDYLEILKIEKENVWFFYQNLVVNYNFKKNLVVKTYNLTSWNAHQVILDSNKLWLISKNDGQLYGLQLELTQKELDEKAARFKKEKESEFTKPNSERVAAEKAAKEKYKTKK